MTPIFGRRLLRVAIVVLASVGLAACASENPASAPSAIEKKTFDGTPDEYVVLFRACLEDQGMKTGDILGSEDVGFSIDLTDGLSPAERQQIQTECGVQIGEPRISKLPIAELEKRYEARVIQLECLATNGLTIEPPVSFEVFQSNYERSGQKRLWEPTQGLEPVERNGTLMGPTDICPRSGDSW